ncbi:uncharacterized protein LOC144472335 isoform X1 [Augochlora pura]
MKFRFFSSISNPLHSIDDSEAPPKISSHSQGKAGAINPARDCFGYAEPAQTCSRGKAGTLLTCKTASYKSFPLLRFSPVSLATGWTAAPRSGGFSSTRIFWTPSARYTRSGLRTTLTPEPRPPLRALPVVS